MAKAARVAIEVKLTGETVLFEHELAEATVGKYVLEASLAQAREECDVTEKELRSSIDGEGGTSAFSGTPSAPSLQ